MFTDQNGGCVTCNSVWDEALGAWIVNEVAVSASGTIAASVLTSVGTGISSAANFFADHYPGGDFLYEVNKFNPIAIIANSVSVYSSGKDTYGAEQSVTDATVNLAMVLPLGRIAGTGARLAEQGLSLAAKGAGLADDVAKTFRFGRYTEVTLDKPMVLARYYDNVNAFAKGRFMTNATSSFTFLDRMRMAIRPSWNGMTKVAHWQIPAGSTIYQGRAAMQFPWLGGKTQYFIPELGKIKRVIK
jgi:hypothetical protein